jgi:hypothetical protein
LTPGLAGPEVKDELQRSRHAAELVRQGGPAQKQYGPRKMFPAVQTKDTAIEVSDECPTQQ